MGREVSLTLMRRTMRMMKMMSILMIWYLITNQRFRNIDRAIITFR